MARGPSGPPPTSPRGPTTWKMAVGVVKYRLPSMVMSTSRIPSRAVKSRESPKAPVAGLATMRRICRPTHEPKKAAPLQVLPKHPSCVEGDPRRGNAGAVGEDRVEELGHGGVAGHVRPPVVAPRGNDVDLVQARTVLRGVERTIGGEGHAEGVAQGQVQLGW